MRTIVAALMLALSSAIAAAQQRAPQPPPPPPQAAAPPLMLPYPPVRPPVAGGLTSGFPFSPPDSTLPPRDLYRVGPGNRVYSRTHPRLPYGYGGSYFYGPDVEPPQAPAAEGAAPREPTGMLRLLGTPASAQVFVDRFYTGTLEDIEAQRVLTLPAGPHRIEIRAADYETATFDVRIDPNDTVTYRAALEPLRRAVPARTSAPAAGPTKMYLIPNCYLGNVPPRSERLPRGCDIKRLRAIP